MAGLLKINPNAIEFPLVLFQSITTTLRLENVADKPVAFKIKTTAPKNYLVRPSTGVISRDNTQYVQIILQPMQTEPAIPCADRFLVQATPTEHDDTNPPRDFWANLPKNEVTDQRLNVVFKKETLDTSGSAGATDGLSDQKGAPVGVHAAAKFDGNTTAKDNFAGSSSSMHGDLPGDYEGLKKKYIALLRDSENEKYRLQQDLQNMRDRQQQFLQQSGRGEADDGAASRTGPLGSFNIEMWHAIAILFVLLLVLRFLGYI